MTSPERTQAENMNRLALSAPVALSLVAAAATSAGAQPAPPPPPPTPADPALPAGAYPLDLVDRPLMLPASMLEADAHFATFVRDGVDLFDFMDLVLAARYSTGSFEPFAGIDFMLIQPDGSEGETLQSLFAGVRAPVGPGYARATFTRYAPVADFSLITLDGRFEYKQKMGEKLAVVAEGGLYMTLLSADFGGSDLSGNSIGIIGRGAGQVQLAPLAALEGGLQLQLPVASGDNQDPDVIDWNTVTTLFGGVLYAASPKFDVFARMEISLAGEDAMGNSNSQTTFILGALVRPM